MAYSHNTRIARHKNEQTLLNNTELFRNIVLSKRSQRQKNTHYRFHQYKVQSQAELINVVGSQDNGYPWVHRVVMGRGPRDFWNVGHAPWLLDLDVGDMGVSLLCELSPGCTLM